jgi:hypothetical protein
MMLLLADQLVKTLWHASSKETSLKDDFLGRSPGVSKDFVDFQKRKTVNGCLRRSRLIFFWRSLADLFTLRQLLVLQLDPLVHCRIDFRPIYLAHCSFSLFLVLDQQMRICRSATRPLSADFRF